VDSISRARAHHRLISRAGAAAHHRLISRAGAAHHRLISRVGAAASSSTTIRALGSGTAREFAQFLE